MKKTKKIILNFLTTVFILLLICIALVFTTDHGYKLRVIAAEAILSSQHRSLVTLTFLSQDKIDELTLAISDPNYINSHGTKTSDRIIDSINQQASTKDSATRLQELYEKMIEDRKNKENQSKLGTVNQNKVKEKKARDEKLVVKLTSINKKYSDHYFKGKLLEISNPKNVKLTASKGKQVNAQFGEQINFIADRVGAIAATNAGGFQDTNGNGNGGVPLGIVIESGEIITTPKGNKSKAFVAGLTDKGLLITGYYSANQLMEMNVEHAAGFKPQLIVNGEKMIKDGNGGWGYGPRTAIGQKEDGTIILIVVDGRQPHSIGASIKDIQNIMYEYGAVNAMAMDGGSSAIMHYNGSNITSPSSVGGVPRYIPNAWVVIPNKNQIIELHENGKLKKTYTHK